jgi:transcriptional regulator with XRE-family HTH domain
MEPELRWSGGSAVLARDVAAFAFLGRVVRTARLSLGLTKRHLERLSGVDQTTISRLENGKLTSLRLVRVAAIFMALSSAIRLAVPG